ncbi:facilitated trehalose transporter Tret1-like [Leguminivora glycinivorella]|uniref:facilitated trehalose transporter Tret1-like n=1 Tax=Leguminivora glycinivorella TaxID=1035111 RepID=UPI00200C66B5|nr:facilitated trehalose transporter Tret1-like [Leguminivora glycinivorella]
MLADKRMPFVRQCLVAAAVSINMAGFGCSTGFLAIMLPQLQKPGSTISVSKEQASWLVSVGTMTLVFGTFLVPSIMSRLGRKVALYVITVVSILAWCTYILATSYEVLLLGAMAHGFSFGMFAPLRSIYIGECSSPHYRGGLLTTCVESQIFGVLFVHLIGSLISFQSTAISCLPFPVTSLLLTIYSPESPSWLATKGDFDRCEKNFIWLRGEDEIAELKKMIQTANLPRDPKTVKEMIAVIKKKEFFKPILLMFTLYIIVTCAGGLVMAVYAVTVFELLMGPEVNARIWMVSLDCLRALSTIIAVFVINKVKRRKMLFSVGSICVGSQLCIGAYVFARNRGYLPLNSWMPGILKSVQMMSVSMGMQPLPGVIAGEIYPLEHRSISGSIGLTMLSLSAFAVLKSYPSLISGIGLEGAYFLFSGIITVCLMVAWMVLPETSGRTLQEVEDHFRVLEPEAESERQPLLHSVNSVTTSYLSTRK